MGYRLAATSLAAILAASPTVAQGQSLGDVEQMLRPGDRIRVVARDGTVVDADFDGVSASSLRVVRKRAIVEYPAAQIIRIRRPRREPDGILIGLGIGAGAGLGLVALRCSQSSESSDCRRVGSLVVAGPTAAAGAGLDWAVRRFDTIFEVPSATRLRVGPILSDRRRGIAIALIY